MEIQVTLKTSAYRGDHASDVSIGLKIDPSMTIDQLVNSVFENGIKDEQGGFTRLADKLTDFLVIRIENTIEI